MGTRKSVAVGILMLFLIGNGVISARTEKPGAILVVQKKDGQTIKGELLSVKNGMLNLLIYENATKVDVHLNEVRSLGIEKKGSFLKGLGTGVLWGAVTGALLGFLSGDDKPESMWDIFSFSAGQKALVGGIFFGVVGGAVGGIAGALKGADESIIIPDVISPEKLGRVEAKLASRARYRSVPITEP